MMKKILYSLAAMLVAFIATACAGTKTLQENTGNKDWTVLFDGTDTEQWENPYEWGDYKIAGDELHLTTETKKWFLTTKKEYADFILELDIKIPAGGNSGVMFRCFKKKNKVWGYQAEFDTSNRNWTGGLYDEGRRGYFISPNRDYATSVKEYEDSVKAFRERAGHARKLGEWNTYRIECKGTSIKIYINDVLTTDINDDWDLKGYIGIQHHGEIGKTYKFRNIRLKALGDNPPYAHNNKKAPKRTHKQGKPIAPKK